MKKKLREVTVIGGPIAPAKPEPHPAPEPLHDPPSPDDPTSVPPGVPSRRKRKK